MKILAVSTVQVLLSFTVYIMIVAWFVSPILRRKNIYDALTPLLFLHAIRYIGLTYLVPVVVDPRIPLAFANPTAYGDLLSAILAIITIVALRYLPTTSWANLSILLAWVFNVIGFVDLAIALTLGARAQVLTYQLSAMWFIPTFIVPVLIITHLLIFWMLLKHHRGEWH